MFNIVLRGGGMFNTVLMGTGNVCVLLGGMFNSVWGDLSGNIGSKGPFRKSISVHKTERKSLYDGL